ncbi:TatD family deoxyribonuclease [Bifidobacterium aerophilum]|uniref:TatD family deoxyribonuclease n=2 Tax=Bifidobacterium aerophilum TaxID=1798155 RepID=A0A6N9Z523_9BIFI|nr:TatD family deoxyribonuclease [Bifidobacterium aerophilum]
MCHDVGSMSTCASLLSDAHCHADDARFVAAQRKYGVSSVISCANGDQWRHASAWIGDSLSIRASFGIHPWDADRYRIADAMPYLEQTLIVGEIGLDGEWTDVPLAAQLPVFEAQLDYASRRRKPVVLHTKSREREVLELIRRYPNRYMVHWYACDRWQDDYLDLGCYMSIGPDVTTDESVRRLAARIPDDRLLVESDGLESLTWAMGREYGVDDYVDALTGLLRSLTAIRAAVRGRATDVCEVAEMTRRNLASFCVPIPSRPL